MSCMGRSLARVKQFTLEALCMALAIPHSLASSGEIPVELAHAH